MKLLFDPLSNLFILLLIVLTVPSVFFSIGYTKHEKPFRKLVFFSFFILLFISLTGVFLSRNVIGFLIFWELMTLTSFALVVFYHEDGTVRKSGWYYLTASQAGTALLFIFFSILKKGAPSWDFVALANAAATLDKSTSVKLFILALAGFGVKAGIVPLHIWLPKAHPAAPAPVSAIMSGVLIKAGIYGILLTLFMLCSSITTAGWILLIVGALTAVTGSILAVSQENIKRLLAYSSIENIGIIIMGLALFVISNSKGLTYVSLIALTGSIFHIISHGVFKGLLFLSAGSIQTRTGTVNMEWLGGLAKKMPFTALGTYIGAHSMAAIPPLSGFIGEALIFIAAFTGVIESSSVASAGIVTVVAIALAGGLAAIIAAKLFSITFLGNARSEESVKASESGRSIFTPIIFLAVISILFIPLAPQIFKLIILPILRNVPSISGTMAISEAIPAIQSKVNTITIVNGAFVTIFLCMVLVRHAISKKTIKKTGLTWDCGYEKPSVSMQYTGSSFVQPISDMFFFFLRNSKKTEIKGNYFPSNGSFSTEASDAFESQLIHPFFSSISRRMENVRIFQHGRLRFYVLYIAITLVVLLLWKL